MCRQNGTFYILHILQTLMDYCNRSSVETSYSACFVISGSLWDPQMTAHLSVDKEHKKLSIVVGFEVAEYSERYQVSVQSYGVHCSKNVSKVITLNLSLILSVISVCNTIECTCDIKMHFLISLNK